ncbi:MAG TPA: hypothetical protein DDW94_12500 [Deltaproteobacteria bacterium]|nr:MAG: hypothetical protein A2Z79_08645 [Deltaproteobacteria bacterium GWA2_55_82]OGQ64523.1 MAG: hypothetical protein A3I81_07635 [Deltaproteobacteria bacterium RIFCSPLOWO2_02_FULL_55_12]OIJ73649.1 MAG: hypothetical protein A2V21_304840 [Deltaproteobacteria bacterium GWC2_55_46]HBG47790.1 hypothetical protein [Deltaproteobacteria bacterium]HCY11988.1 hypothetical protein [Deltaproteobacteria bacterium]
MPSEKNKNVNRLLLALLAVLAILFSVSVGKHLSYPLLWNDEGDTAMFATRVLEYGYPKVHDGKNVLYVHPVDMRLGVNEHDMFTADPLLCYYWAVPGAWLAQKAEDIYARTFLFRAPFALTGLVGMIVMAALAGGLFEKRRPGKLLFYSLFALFALLSVSLALHLREARYYSPVILLSAIVLYFFINHRLLGRLSFGLYAAVSVAALFLIYNAFYPTYFVLIGFIGLCESLALVKRMWPLKGSGKAFTLPGIRDLKPFIPIFASVLTVVPPIVFFRTMEVVSVASTDNFGPGQYIRNIANIIHYFAQYEFLYLALFMKGVLACLIVRDRLSGAGPFGAAAEKVRVSNLLTLFFIVHVLVTAVNPLIMSTHYFIVLLPVLPIILLLDAFSIFALLGRGAEAARKRRQAVFVSAAAALLFINGLNKMKDLSGHIYELTHQYSGPVDAIVSYVKENYENTEGLVIATNYEEASLMYYLGSKVVVGYRFNTIREDMKEVPDVIIHRRSWAGFPYVDAFNYFMQKAEYEKVALQVRDHPVNNIPDLHYEGIRHLYRTPIAATESERLKVYVRKE